MDGKVYIGSYDNRLYSFSSTGSLLWSYETGSFIESSPAVDSGGRVYVGSAWGDNRLYSINSDGSLLWSYETGSSIYSSPAIGGDGTIYFGSEDNNIYAINYFYDNFDQEIPLYDDWKLIGLSPDACYYVAGHEPSAAVKARIPTTHYSEIVSIQSFLTGMGIHNNVEKITGWHPDPSDPALENLRAFGMLSRMEL